MRFRPRQSTATARAETVEEAQAEPEVEATAEPEADVAQKGETADKVAAEATQAATEDESDAASKEESKQMGVPNVPNRPTEVGPAGKQLEKPAEVKLKGPNVVRVEKPDPVAPPRRSRPQGGGGAGPRTQPSGDMVNVPGITRSRGPARGHGAGGRGGDEGEGDRNRSRGKRRSLTSRRGRSAEGLPTGPAKLSEQDLLELDARLKGAPGFIRGRRRDLRRRESATQAQSAAVTGGKVEISEPIFIKDLSAATGIKGADIIKYLFTQKGVMANINSAIGAEAAMEVCLEYNIELEVKAQKTAAEEVEAEFEEQEATDTRARPPIVTVLGHVDHGKTSLLDRIRKADVAHHEDGGITQHVGAYRVTIEGHDEKEKTVVFLDTPGHEAFTTMRARGAKLTDVVILVVAADDGVMPQTIESINHAKAAGVPIVVALNKCDLPAATDSNIQKIYGQLAEHELNPVAWGGETEVLKVSAETGDGITELLEIVDYQAELLEISADYGGNARGTVIEAEMQEGRGSVARVMVEQGQLKVGDFIVIGRAFGRVRDMTDDRDRSIKEAGPATPLELSGIDMVPDAGDKFFVTSTLQRAEQVANHFRETERMNELGRKTKVTLDNFALTLDAGGVQELRVVLKADVQGSIETLRKSLEEIGNKEVRVRVLHAAVGGVTESDVLLADASDAVVIGFHVVAPTAVKEIADERRVDIRLYRVIYDVTDDVKKALEGMLTPEVKEETLGEAEVKEVFKISKLGNVAGCMVTEGTVQRDALIRVIRDDVIVTDGRKLSSLRRVKDDAKEVRAGTECGIRLEGFDDLKPGDKLVCFRKLEVARKLED